MPPCCIAWLVMPSVKSDPNSEPASAVAQNASARQFSTMPIFVAGLFYFVMNWIVSAGFDRIEKKLSYYR